MLPLHTHHVPKIEIPAQVIIKCRPSHKFPDKKTCYFFDYNEIMKIQRPKKGKLDPDFDDILEANIKDLFQIPQKRKKLELPEPLFSARTRPGLISIKGPPPYKCTVVPTLVGPEHYLFAPQGPALDYDNIDFLVDCKSSKLKPSEGKRVVWGRP